MTLTEIHQFINALWRRIIKPTWSKPLDDIDFEALLQEAVRLDDEYDDHELTAKMINAYMIALEHKEDKA